MLTRGQKKLEVAREPRDVSDDDELEATEWHCSGTSHSIPNTEQL